MVPLVGNIYTIGTNLIANGTIGKEIGENGHTIGTNGTIWSTPNTCYVLSSSWYGPQLIVYPFSGVCDQFKRSPA